MVSKFSPWSATRVLAVLILGSLNIQAQVPSLDEECKKWEAHFIGRVIETRHKLFRVMSPGDGHPEQKECKIRLELSHFSPHGLCPIQADDAVQIEWPDQKCELQLGQPLSGVLVRTQNGLQIDR